MAGTPPATTRDLTDLIRRDVPKNVIATGVGSLPNNQLILNYSPIHQYYATARAAAVSQLTSPHEQLDRDLLSASSPRLARLSQAALRAETQSRFKQVTKITPLPNLPAPLMDASVEGTLLR